MATNATATAPSEMTDHQIFVLSVLERLGGSLSLLGTLLIFLAYRAYKRLRTVQNTFIVFASIANVGAAVPSIIAYSGMYANQRTGTNTALCQAQGFMFEMFVQSDPWWALAMALNVFAVFFLGTSPATFHKWGWAYCLVCYGGPFLIAITLLFHREPGRTEIYGPAGLWCWISSDWSTLRISTYYGLIWVCVFLSMAVYIAIGYHVFQSRNRLENFRFTSSYARTTTTADDNNNNNNSGSNTAYATKVTEIRVTDSFDVAGILSQVDNTKRAHLPSRSGDGPGPSSDWTNPYRLGSAPQPSRTDPMVSTMITSESANLPSKKKNSNNNRKSLWKRFTKSLHATLNMFKIEDQVKAAYLRTSLLFALSVMVTWVPSSVNRIRGLTHSDTPFGFNLATAVVLPLQGVWNAVIFFVTSWATLKECTLQTRAKWNKNKGGEKPVRDVERGLPPMRCAYGYESDHYVTNVTGGLQKDESAGSGLGGGGGGGGGGSGPSHERSDSWEFMDSDGRQGSDVELRRVSDGT